MTGTDDGAAELFRAIDRSDAARVSALLEQAPELARSCVPSALAPRGQERWSQLHAAVRVDDPEVLTRLLDAGADPDARNDEGRTPAHDAFEDGRRALELLLGRGCEVDAALAAGLGDVERLRDMLDEDPYLAEDPTTGLNPLGWAAYGDQPDALQELVSRGARIEGHELACAASCGHVAVARKLLELGADPNARGANGGTALHAAARSPHARDTSAITALLLERGADPDAADADGRTALAVALDPDVRAAGHADPGAVERVVELLRAAGASA